MTPAEVLKPSQLPRHLQVELIKDFRDHENFCRESLTIRNLTGSQVPMLLGSGQKKAHEIVTRQKRAGKPIRLVTLKTRRSWFTSGMCAEMFHEIPFFPGRRGMVIADRFNPAGLEAFDYLKQFQSGYKPFTRHNASITLPALISDAKQSMKWANQSTIDVFSADSGEIRGGGRHWVLGDEVAFWRAPEKTLTGVLNMVPYSAGTAVFIQSTANGVGGEFYEMCQTAQNPNNEYGFEFLFFGWLEHEPYRIPLEGRPEHFLDSLDKEEQTLHTRYGASLEQLNWRRKTIAIECRGKVDLFYQEYPTTPEEAFLQSGRPVFDPKEVSRHISIPGTSGELEIIENPPQRRLAFVPREHGALTIWNRPEPGHLYLLGADPSQGIDVSSTGRGDDPDYSVGFVADRHTGQQVALLRGRIRPVAFAEYLALLGRWFNWAYIVPEANDAGFIESLIRTGYPLEAVYTRQRDPTDRRTADLQEIGFKTTGETRSWLIAAAEDSIRNLEITIKSGVVIQECRTFVIKPNGRKEHQLGCHDDCVIAYGLTAIGQRTAPRKQIVTGSEVGKAKISFYGRAKRKEEEE